MVFTSTLRLFALTRTTRRFAAMPGSTGLSTLSTSTVNVAVSQALARRAVVLARVTASTTQLAVVAVPRTARGRHSSCVATVKHAHAVRQCKPVVLCGNDIFNGAFWSLSLGRGLLATCFCSLYGSLFSGVLRSCAVALAPKYIRHAMSHPKILILIRSTCCMRENTCLGMALDAWLVRSCGVVRHVGLRLTSTMS